MVSIDTNISSLVAQRSLRNSTSKLNNAIEQMTTGYKITHAKDNAANYSIAVDMSTKIGAYDVAEDNCAMALDLVNTANDTLDLIIDKMTRVKELHIQGANGTYDTDSKKAIKKEVAEIYKEVIRIKNNCEYNGLNLLDGRKQFTFQIGINGTDSSEITVETCSAPMHFYFLVIGANTDTDTDTDTDFSPGSALDAFLKILSQKQSELGAVQNRLESALEAISVQRDNLISSRSTIKDTDVAEISSQYIKQQILQQASATLLATANQSPSIALQLI